MAGYAEMTAVVTGGSSGIGRAMGLELARRGASVCLVARNRERLAQVKAEAERLQVAERVAGAVVETLAVDLSDWPQTQAVLGEWLSRRPAPQLLINCAGSARPGRIEELDPPVFQEMMASNYFTAVHATKALLPGMLARGSGHLVYVSSLAGFLPVYGYSAYGAAKFALVGFAEVLRAELEPCGLKFSIAFPPNTDTPGLVEEDRWKPAVTRKLEGKAKTLSADAVAQAILKKVEAGRFIITPGWEGALYYRLRHPLAKVIHLVMDRMVAKASRDTQP